MKKGNVFVFTGSLLIAAALLLTGYNFWDSIRAGKEADAALAQLIPMITDNSLPSQEGKNGTNADPAVPGDEIEYPDYVLNPNMDMPVIQIEGNDYIGVISIPSMGIELPVFSEWNYKNLKTSTCRYAGSAYLDNMVICAHNYDLFFGSLKNLSYGDLITFTDVDGNVFNYEVSEIETLQPTAIKEMTSGDCDLTLFTCTISGRARVTVRCEKAEF